MESPFGQLAFSKKAISYQLKEKPNFSANEGGKYVLGEGYYLLTLPTSRIILNAVLSGNL
jgi:hypothetical protein